MSPQVTRSILEGGPSSVGLEVQSRTWTQSVPPAVAGGYVVDALDFAERHVGSSVYCTMRLLAIAFQCVLLLTVAILIPRREGFAQTKPPGSARSPHCSRENALEMIKQQIDVSRTLNDNPKRIAVLIRAAVLLWPYQQDNFSFCRCCRLR